MKTSFFETGIKTMDWNFCRWLVKRGSSADLVILGAQPELTSLDIMWVGLTPGAIVMPLAWMLWQVNFKKLKTTLKAQFTFQRKTFKKRFLGSFLFCLHVCRSWSSCTNVWAKWLACFAYISWIFRFILLALGFKIAVKISTNSYI